MPSPFPGMDPYLEGSLWMSVHTQLSAEIARQLSPKIRPKYLALTTEHFVYEDPDDVAVTTAATHPDVSLATSGRPGPPAMDPIPHVTVEIRDTAERRLVCAIEVLSPTNKKDPGREEYLAKRRRLLLSTAHLVEIDLLRRGKRVPMAAPLPLAPYFVLVGRVASRPVLDVWPIRLDQSLPDVPIPLLDGDPDASLELQTALTQVYDLLNYDLAVDYSGPPEIPLDENDRAWAEAVLRAAGLRP